MTATAARSKLTIPAAHGFISHVTSAVVATLSMLLQFMVSTSRFVFVLPLHRTCPRIEGNRTTEMSSRRRSRFDYPGNHIGMGDHHDMRCAFDDLGGARVNAFGHERMRLRRDCGVTIAVHKP